MRVLIACEYSGVVREAFKSKGHDAVSCDILPTEIPGEHYQGDVMDIIDDGWDLMIGFPPCTYISHAANGSLKNDPDRIYKQFEAIGFFMYLYNCNIPKVALENPRGWIPRYFRQPDQVINPFDFGDPYRKRTNLWLKNLPFLMCGARNPAGMIPSKVYKRKTGVKAGGNYGCYWHQEAGNAKLRAKTFPGIAQAMADQWG